MSFNEIIQSLTIFVGLWGKFQEWHYNDLEIVGVKRSIRSMQVIAKNLGLNSMYKQ